MTALRKAQDEDDEQLDNTGSDEPEEGGKTAGGKIVGWVLNGLIVLLLPLIGFSAYLYFSPKAASPGPGAGDGTTHSPQTELRQGPGGDTASAAPAAAKKKVIQLDVLNGCGVKGAGIKMTSFLRTSGFDVVEMKNYKSFHVPKTLVVDRVGDLAMARQVAAALGVGEKNVIQQINPDYYVDVSVIIGKDYQELVGTSK